MLHKRLIPDYTLSNPDKNPLEPFKYSIEHNNLDNPETIKRTLTDLTLITGTSFNSDITTKIKISNKEFNQTLSDKLSSKLNNQKELHGLTINEFTEHITQISLNSKSSNQDERNLILAYSLRTRQLHELQKRLNYSYCASNCHYSPIGCCSTNCYETGITPEIARLQKLEANYNGLDPKLTKKDKKFCLYHSEEEGCKILLFKSPPAFRFFCKPLKKNLKKKYGPNAEKFAESLSNMKPPYLRENPKTIINHMDKAIINGKNLLLYHNN